MQGIIYDEAVYSVTEENILCRQTNEAGTGRCTA
jgi:hypothetical protein